MINRNGFCSPARNLTFESNEGNWKWHDRRKDTIVAGFDSFKREDEA